MITGRQVSISNCLRSRQNKGCSICRSLGESSRCLVMCSSVSDTLYCSWEPHIHPEGWVYYYTSRPSRAIQYSTSAHLHEFSILSEINRVVEVLDFKLQDKSYSHHHGSLVEVVIDRLSEGCYQYYMVNHASKCLFYAEDVENPKVLAHPSMENTVQSKQHLRMYFLTLSFCVR